MLCLLAILGSGLAQTSRPAEIKSIIAMDHLEAKGVTAWIVESPSGRSLVVARGGAGPVVRLRGLLMCDVLLDPTGKTAFLLVDGGKRFALEQLVLDGDAAPRIVVPDLAPPIVLPKHTTPDLVLRRSGDDVILMTEQEVLAISWEGVSRPVFRRDDARIQTVARNPGGSLFAIQRFGDVETVDPDGTVLKTFGQGWSPEFLADDVFAEASLGFDAEDPLWHPYVVSVHRGPKYAREAVLQSTDQIHRLRVAGSGELLFRQAPRDEVKAHYWLLHWRSRVVRPIEPADLGRLATAIADTTTRPTVPIDDSPGFGVQVQARVEPEAAKAGFFRVDKNGLESRTAYEVSGWDDARHPDEARTHEALLDKFLAGVQWPLPREAGYEPYFSPDDEPLRTSSTVRHLGLDLGARLRHVATGSVAYYAGGAPVQPLWRGGTLASEAPVALREGESPLGSERYRVLQEVVVREGGYVLRVYIAYEHVKPFAPKYPTPLGVFREVSGADAFGGLEPFSDASPSGGWSTGDPTLAAHGIGKGNHVHVGIGGIYRSFNTTPEAGARKLRWYRERLIPALRAAAALK